MCNDSSCKCQEKIDILVCALRRFLSYGDIFGYKECEGNPYEQAMAAIAKAEGTGNGEK